jgi:hypothetical protein
MKMALVEKGMLTRRRMPWRKMLRPSREALVKGWGPDHRVECYS